MSNSCIDMSNIYDSATMGKLTCYINTQSEQIGKCAFEHFPYVSIKRHSTAIKNILNSRVSALELSLEASKSVGCDNNVINIFKGIDRLISAPLKKDVTNKDSKYITLSKLRNYAQSHCVEWKMKQNDIFDKLKDIYTNYCLEQDIIKSCGDSTAKLLSSTKKEVTKQYFEIIQTNNTLTNV